MVESLKRLGPGDPLPGNFAQWNEIADSVDVSRQTNVVGRDARFQEWWANAVPVLLRGPISGVYGVKTGQILSVLEPLTDPSVNIENFLNKIVFVGGRPTWTAIDWGNCAIVTSAFPIDGIGYCHFSGVTRALVKIDKYWHGYCDIDVDETFELKSHPSGSWKIVWSQGVEGEVADWALIQYKGVWQRELKCQIPAGDELAPGTSLTVKVSIEGGDALDQANTKEITVHHNWFDQEGNPIGSESKILAKWFPDELQWVVVAAEC